MVSGNSGFVAQFNLQMDFKSKLKNILQKEGIKKVQNALKPNLKSAESLFPPVQIKHFSRDAETEIRSHPSDPTADEAILESINPIFFTSTFDPSLYEMLKLKDPLDIEDLTASRQRLLKELTVVSKRVFQLILEKQSGYSTEIQRVREIEDELVAAIFTCQEARRDLGLTRKEFTSKSLGLLANHHKRQADKELLQSLKTIHTLQSTETRLHELLAEDNYLGAIQLLLEFQQTAETYKHFTCIAELSKKLLDTMETAEEQLDVALSKVCIHFDERHYAKLQRAYQLLGKTHTCVDQLLMHYASAIHNTAFSVVHGFAELCRSAYDPLTNLQKRPYPDLCACLSQDIFIPCLVDLCKAMWKILVSYHRLLTWHSSESTKQTLPSESSSPLGYTEELDGSEEYVDQKLQHGSSRIWQDIQTKIKTFLLACDFFGFKIDDFMRILSIVHTLRVVGREFCASESESLRDCIREASLRYFLKYHHSKLEELRIFIENEGWEVCPVRSDFDIHKLQEFKFLKTCSDSLHLTNGGGPPVEVSSSYFINFDESGSPFDIAKDTSEEDIYAAAKERPKRSQSKSPKSRSGSVGDQNSLDEEDDGEDADSRTESELECGSLPPITNTSLTILRLFGRYLNLMHLLKPIAHDVAIAMSQLFEYYIYSVFLFFGSENGEIIIDKIANTQLREGLKKIQTQLILVGDEEGDHEAVNQCSTKIPEPNVSPILNLSREEDLFGLPERVVASESGVYLALQFDSLRRFIESHVPESQWESVAQLVDEAVILSEELRKLTFAGVSCRAINYQTTVNRMETVNWEVKELMSQHSSYVDLLLRELQIFSMKVESISARVCIPQPVVTILWEQIFKYCCRAFVDGCSSTKKCSNSGRGLMQLDFTQFLSKLEKIAPISFKGHPDKEYVESYVKAYYMPEVIMEEWIQNHFEYSARQLGALVHCAWNSNRKARQNLLGLIERLEKANKLTKI